MPQTQHTQKPNIFPKCGYLFKNHPIFSAMGKNFAVPARYHGWKSGVKACFPTKGGSFWRREQERMQMRVGWSTPSRSTASGGERSQPCQVLIHAAISPPRYTYIRRTHECAGAALPFGAPLSTSNPALGEKDLLRWTTSVLLRPSAREEILIPLCNASLGHEYVRFCVSTPLRQHFSRTRTYIDTTAN